MSNLTELKELLDKVAALQKRIGQDGEYGKADEKDELVRLRGAIKERKKAAYDAFYAPPDNSFMTDEFARTHRTIEDDWSDMYRRTDPTKKNKEPGGE